MVLVRMSIASMRIRNPVNNIQKGACSTLVILTSKKSEVLEHHQQFAVRLAVIT